MKKLILAAVAATALGACSVNPETGQNQFDEDQAGALMFGVVAMAICVQSGACVPI